MILLVVFGPLLAGLCCLLLQRGLRTAPILAYLVSLGAGLHVLLTGRGVEAKLIGSFGVALEFDRAAAWFVLLNAIVCIAVAWHERYRGRHHYFFILLALLHGCVNACFLSKDLFNLYVVIELTTIVAFLLIGQGMTTRHLWNGLRYIFLSNVSMLFFLLGALLVYHASGDFAFSSVADAPPTARALIITGLLVKGGVFLPGLWLPQAHAEADAAVSALLSGVVVNIGLLPLIRLEGYSPDLERVIRMMAFGGVFTGIGLALFQRDLKRLLACSTISQVSFALLSPIAGPMYAFGHGVAKAALFLCAGNLPERDLRALRETKAGRLMAWPMTVAALSISGCPLLIGYAAKTQVTDSFTGWRSWLVLAASIGTACVLAPIVWMPRRTSNPKESASWRAPAALGAVLLIFGVVSGPFEATTMMKSVAVLIGGWLSHRLLFHKLSAVDLPTGWEKLEHVVGLICVSLVLLLLGVYLP